MNYTPLNVKTEYELLSSLIKIDILCNYVKQNNINAIGITDTNMFGTLEFINACKKNNLKPIIGVPFELESINFILYAKNYNGYVALLNLTSLRNLDTLETNNFSKFKSDLICVTSNYENYSTLKEIFNYVYLSYSTTEEKNNALKYTDKIVYMKEVRYINESDKDYLMYLEMIKDGKTITERNNYKYDNHMERTINESDALTTTNFASLINIELPNYTFELPKYTADSVELLTTLCNKGLNKRLNNVVPDNYKERLNMELDVINSMGYTDYFLIVYDFILYAKKNGIVVGPGRGSAAGSLVSYTLGITEIDPLKYDLIFERFLNKDRVTMPDIDTDIEYLRRNEVVEYIKNKYGKDKVANIITFGTLLPKQVIRDVGRVLNINIKKIDYLTKTIGMETTFEELKKNTLFMSAYQKDYEYTNLIKICQKLEGLKRHTSIHAAGVVISSEPLMNKVPIYMNGTDELTAYTKEYLEDIGLLKIDLLALKNLTIIDRVVKKIAKEKNIYIDVNKIPLDDKMAIKVFYDVNTIGIFQFESSGMMSFLKSLKVSSFNDLVSAIALYRPGPRDMIPEFIKVKECKKKVFYIVPALESILKSTNGIIIYQEQIMQILKVIASFSYSEADNIRRAMSKKKESIILSYQEEFISRALKNGYKKEEAEKIYSLVLKFANYGFNKSHSVAYSMISFQMAFLKAHFPEYFMTTLLDMVVGNDTKTKEYITEAKRFDLIFKKCDINISTDVYLSKDKTVYMPLGSIKNLGKETINAILEIRKNGPFMDYYDFMKRVYKSKVNTKAIETLILSGALDIFNLNKKTMHQNMSSLLEYAKLINDLGENLIEKPIIVEYEEYTSNELLDFEYQSYGFYIDNHPVSKYIRDNTCTLKNIVNYFDKVVETMGLVEYVKEIETKKKEKMAFITISDEEEKREVIMFPKIYNEFYGIKKGDIIKVNGRVERRMSEYQIVANKVEVLNKDK